jgi:hypothetical protein
VEAKVFENQGNDERANIPHLLLRMPAGAFTGKLPAPAIILATDF